MIKKFALSLFLILFIIFSSLVHYKDISRYDIVSGMSFDYDQNKWTVVCEICLPSSNNDFGSKTEYVKGTGFTLEDALYNAGLASSNLLYTDSVQLYLVSESAMDQTELYSFLRSQRSNLRAVAVATEGDAFAVLHSENSSNERAKSLSLAGKLKALCRENGIPTPHVVNLLKTGGGVYITGDGLPERRDVNEK